MPERVDGGTLVVTSMPDGPLMLEGPVELHDRDGNVIFRGDRCALCRCGGTSRAPFCDGTHLGIGFTG